MLLLKIANNFPWETHFPWIQVPKDRSFRDVKHNLFNITLLLLLLSRFSRVRLCNPIDGSPPGSPIPGILQARTLEWVAISFSRPVLNIMNQYKEWHGWHKNYLCYLYFNRRLKKCFNCPQGQQTCLPSSFLPSFCPSFLGADAANISMNLYSQTPG